MKNETLRWIARDDELKLKVKFSREVRKENENCET